MRIKLFLFVLILSFSCSIPLYAGDNDNEHDGNGGGTGRGTGNIPIPADPNNDHGRVNKGNNYNDGVITQVPFDGGWVLLIIVGIGIGLKRGYDKYNKNLVG